MMGATEVEVITYMLWIMSGAFFIKSIICAYLDWVMGAQESKTKVGPACRALFRALWIQGMLLSIVFLYFGTKKAAFFTLEFHLRLGLYMLATFAVVAVCLCGTHLCKVLVEERNRLWP